MSTKHRVDRGVAPVYHPGPAGEMTQGLPPNAGPPYDVDELAPRRRRRIWLLIIAAGAVVVLLVPLLVYAFVGRDSGQSPSSTAPRPAPSAASPEAAATTPAPNQAAPDGRIPLSALRNATLDIPAWPYDARCIGPSGRVKFTNGESQPAPGTGYRLRIPGAVYGDVDRDGAQETVVNISSGAEPGSWQLLVFDRDQAGNIVTLGWVVATTGEIKVISDSVAVTPDGMIRARVGDYLATAGEDRSITQWQNRGYSWLNGRFVQTGGPTAFGQNRRLTELAVTADDLVLGASVDGLRHGNLRVTVTVLKPVVPDHLALTFQLPANLVREGTAWAGSVVDAKDHNMVWVHLLDVAPPSAIGGSQTYTFGLARAGSTVGPDSLVVALGGYAPGADKPLGENNADDNVASARILTAG